MTRHFLIFTCMMYLPLMIVGQSRQGAAEKEDILAQLTSKENGDEVNIEVDSLLVANYYKLIEGNKKVSGIPGYRIRIYSQTGLGAREEQQRTRAKFLSYYPGIDAYNRYDKSYFKIYVGDCRTKSEALKLNDKIKKDFPNTFIVPDNINQKNTD